MTHRWIAWTSVTVALIGCGASSGSDAAVLLDGPSADVPVDASAMPSFHCAPGPTCPELSIAGDPEAELPANPFRGYGDPSLETAPDGTLYLAYSWLSTRVTPPGDRVDFTVETHLSRSDDGGRSFTFVRAVNQPDRRTHWDVPTREGFLEHEVSTLGFRGADWQILWLSYFDDLGGRIEDRTDFYFESTVERTPDALGDTTRLDFAGFATTPSVGAFDASTLPTLADCAVFTEPALFTEAGTTYLAANCLSFVAGARRRDLDRLLLFRQEGDSYGYVGVLLDAGDAAAFGASAFEQADLSLARDGTLLLIVTPLIDGADPHHQGCVVLEVEDLGTARVRRDGEAPHLRARLTADGNGLGPGLCTYEAASETGVLMIVTRFDLMATQPDLHFTMHATGFHP